MKFKQLKLKWIPALFLVIFLMVSLKIVLRVSHSFLKENSIRISTAEVIAGDRKEKIPESTAAPKSTAPSHENAPSPGPAKVETGSPSVAETLSLLQQREGDIRKKEEKLREKEEYLAKIQKDVEQRLKELSTLQKEIQAYRAEQEESKGTKVRSLSKIYGSMKPKEAAKLMENLDDKLVMNIIATMSSDEAASILSNMDVKKAAKISESLSLSR